MGLENRPKIKKEQKGKINESHCAGMRDLGHKGHNISEIMNALVINVSKSTVRYHLFGECTHGDDDNNFVSPVPNELVRNGGPGPSKGEPSVALYPCGDLRFNSHAMKQWGLGGLPAAEIIPNITSCEIWILFKQIWDGELYLVDHNKTHDYSARIQGTDILLDELNINKPNERVLLDFEWMPDNNVLHIDMIQTVSYVS